MEAICCIRFDIISILFTALNLGRRVESAIPGASPFSRGIPAKDEITTSGFSSKYLDNSFDRPRIRRQLASRDHDRAPSLLNRPDEEEWFHEDGDEHRIFLTSKRKNWLDASESCSAEGGRLPMFGFTELNKDTSWSPLHWNAGRWHMFDEDTYSPAYFDGRVVTDADLNRLAQGALCFSIGDWNPDLRSVVSATSPGLKCNVTLPFMCTTANANFLQTQRLLAGRTLKVITDVEIKKIAGPHPGTEVLRCVPHFKDAYNNKTDRPFNIVWILDGAYYPREGIKHGDHSTTINVPYKHFTKYACEVRYLGSFYGNRSQEIEVATPSRGKLGLLIRVRNAAFSSTSLSYDLLIGKLVEAVNNDPGAFNLSRVDSTSEQNDSELFITEYLLSDTSQGRKLADLINFEEKIESLNALLNGSSINQNVTFQESTLKNIEHFKSRIRDGTLVGVQFFAVDRCPLERSASYFWAGGVGQRVQPSLTSDPPAEFCLDENHHRVTRTCTGSLASGAQWVEPFSEKQNCSRASNKSMDTYCQAENSPKTLEEEDRHLGNLSLIQTPSDGFVFKGGSLVQRRCIGNHYNAAYCWPAQAWNADGQLVNLSSNFICASLPETTSRLLNMTEIQQNASSVLAELQQVTSQWSPIVADVQLIAIILSNASRAETEFSQPDVEQTASIIQQVLDVNTETLASAQRLPNVSTNFLKGIEEILIKTENNSTVNVSALGATAKLEGSSVFLFAANSSNLGGLSDTVANTIITHSKSPGVTGNHHHDALVIFNVSSLMANRVNASKIAFVYHTNIRLADAAVAAGETYANVYSPDASDDGYNMLRTTNHTANSAMVQVAVEGGPVNNVSELVNVYFRPFQAANASNSTNSVVCASWNSEVNNGHGGWSTQGCSYQGVVNGSDHCQCNHLSSFTAFLAYKDYDSNLNRLIKIGCVLSLIGCFGVIATYAFFPKWRQPKPGFYGNHVIFQLSLALAMLLSTFLGGFDQTSNEGVCLLVAALLHYLTLVVFCWMLVEAYWHYSFFLRVLGSMTSYFMWKAFLIAWVLPLAPVVALVIHKMDLYDFEGRIMYCSLKSEGFYSALLPFAILIGLIILAVFIRIIVKVGCAKPNIRSTQRKRSFTHYTAIVMFCIMELSWIFGFLAIGRAGIVFNYLFCIFNSLQGFAIFLHFLFRGKTALEEWQNGQNFIEGKSDQVKPRDSVLDQGTSGATFETSLDSSTGTTQSRIIGELQNRPRQQNSSRNETCNL